MIPPVKLVTHRSNQVNFLQYRVPAPIYFCDGNDLKIHKKKAMQTVKEHLKHEVNQNNSPVTKAVTNKKPRVKKTDVKYRLEA